MSSEMVERVARALSKPLANMNGGCFKPDNGRSERGECADGDCYCSRVTRHCARAAIEEMREPVRKVLERAGDRLGGVSIERMEGDNLAITLCSHFDDPDQEMDETGWTEAAVDGCDETLSAIRAHYTAAITAALGGE